MNKKEGFTLLELMIVVAIIGILAAIAVNMFGDITRKSTEALTKGNLGTIRSALSIYYGGNDGIYPSDDLSSLTISKRYLLVIPITRIQPYHGDSNQVTPESVISETGGWSYNNSESDAGWGTVHVGCLHQDVKTLVWSQY